MRASRQICAVLLLATGGLISANVLADEPATAPATQPATQPATAPIAPGSPRGDLKAFSDELPGGGLKAAREAYYAANDKEEHVADILSKADMAASELEALTRDKFGKDSVDDIDHAMRMRSDNDIQAAKEELDNDHATINWADNKDPLKMIKIDGKWRIDVSDLTGDDSSALIKEETEATEALEKLVSRVKVDEFSNAYLLERAVKQQMFRILGEEED